MKAGATAAVLAALLVAPGALGVAACGRGTHEGAAAGTTVAIDLARVPAFSGDSAFLLLRHQVGFGPRVPGMPGHGAQLAWMREFLAARADTVADQAFTHVTAAGDTLRLTNLFARFRPAEPTRVLLLAHWDTRPTADMDEPEHRDTPIDGANDGASGVAVLLQLADVLSRHSPPIGIDILLVDGEDYGPDARDMYLGAKHFAENQPPGYRPLYGILVDMVADHTPHFPMEGYSVRFAPEVVDRVWRVAEQIGLGHVFTRRRGLDILDDHVPLNRAGIRTINIIDFEYGPRNAYWHTRHDRLENTGPLGLEAVGRVLAALIYNGG